MESAYCLILEQEMNIHPQPQHRRKSLKRGSILKVKTRKKSLKQDEAKRRSICETLRLSCLRHTIEVAEDAEIVPTNTNSAGPSSLRFADVEIREYEVTVSDNPGVKSGVALELGWRYNVHEPIQIDEFEGKRSTERSQDFMKEKKLSKFERERLLKKFGVTQKDMDVAAKQAAIIRNQRKKSVRLRRHDELHEKIENGTSNVKSLLQRLGRRHMNETVAAEERKDVKRASALLAMMDYQEAKNSGTGILKNTSHTLTTPVCKDSKTAQAVGSKTEKLRIKYHGRFLPITFDSCSCQ